MPLNPRRQRNAIMMEKIDMMGNLQDITNLYQQLKQNPLQVLGRRFNIPQNVNLSDPNAILQHLMNTGQVTQSQINGVMSMRNNPLIQQLIRQ